MTEIAQYPQYPRYRISCRAQHTPGARCARIGDGAPWSGGRLVPVHDPGALSASAPPAEVFPPVRGSGRLATCVYQQQLTEIRKVLTLNLTSG